MLGGNRHRAAGIALAALVAVLGFAGSAVASGGDRVIQVQDACDPATFDAAVGPGTCVRPDHSGRFVTFPEFVARVTEKRSHNAWRFDRDHVTLKAGENLTVEMGRGGEFHTFSEVKHFGPGCVDFLNALVFPGQGPPFTPVTTCPPDPAEGVAPGAPALHFRLSRGTHLFQCAIHPWMRSTVTVR
jgi:plastocyanin